jgi:tRNA dimethylallyltransferase
MITILGPTASGKTSLAVALACALDAEIISGDSRQVYRRMDIGTGKDLDEYCSNGKSIPFHLINICEPGEKYNIFRYQHDFFRAYDNIIRRGKVPILCGGSGLYMEAALKGYNLPDVPPNPLLREMLKDKSLPELADILSSYKRLHNKTDIDSAQRAVRAIEIEEFLKTNTMEANSYPPVESLVFGIEIDRDERRMRISQRLRNRLDEGMIEEVQCLLASPEITAEDLIYYGLEYKYITLYLTGQIDRDTMFRQLEIAIHQFAKRQMTWFRGMERRGIRIHWINAGMDTEEKVALILHHHNNNV